MPWKPTIAIIGAGLYGICAAIQIKQQLGLTSICVYEKGKDIGGTLFENKYPGCCCDIPSHLYSFSFAPNPDWSETFAKYDEILDYLNGVVDTFDVRKYIQFNSYVSAAEWNSQKKVWCLTVHREYRSPEIVEANILIAGTGFHREVNLPENLVKNFSGDWVHSARWRSNFEYVGKTVAVIGSGTSAVQIIPSIAPEVKELYVFQRTPSWVVPKGNTKYSDSWKFFLRWCPPAQTLFRWSTFIRGELLYPALRETDGWYHQFVAHSLHYAMSAKLEHEVPSESLRKQLTPNFEIGCKRIAFSDDYLPTFSRKNVHLITSPISKVDGYTIYNENGCKTKVDAIILATGFNATKFCAPMRVTGNNKISLEQQWSKKNPESFYGMCLRDFPNIFFSCGPSSILGPNSMIFMIECQVNAMINIIKEMIATNSISAEIKYLEQQNFNIAAHKLLKHSVWHLGSCNNKTENDEVYTMWPKNCISFWNEIRKITLNQFDTQKKH